MHPNILEIHIEEPTSNPAQKSIHNSLADNLVEAEKRYRAIIHVLISQLTGLSQTHVRFIVSPAESQAVEAVSFWILPLFRGKTVKAENHFHFTPEQNAPGFSIDFVEESSGTKGYQKAALLSAHCPECSSRWINTAMLQCTEEHHVLGRGYLTIQHLNHTAKTESKTLPDLPLIHSDTDWHLALDSPIGPKLAKFHDEISRNL